jgi:hypothetical protein
MLHSIWLPTSEPERPFVRVKEDEEDPELHFDISALKKLVDHVIEFRYRADGFFIGTIPGYSELPATLYDSTRPGAQLRVKDVIERELERDARSPGCASGNVL